MFFYLLIIRKQLHVSSHRYPLLIQFFTGIVNENLKKKVKIEIFQSYWTHMQYVIWIYKVLKSCVFVGNLFYMWVQRIFTPSNSTEELIRGISRENGNDNTIV